MKIIKSKSVVPIYLIGLVWILYSVLFPFYRLSDFIIVSILSILLYLFAAFAIPSLFVKKEYKSIDTGDSYTDEMLISAIDNLEKIRLLRNAISNETVRKQIGILENDSRQIMEYIKTHPDKGIKISQFFLYYLPTTVKLINNYKELEKQELVGINHSTGMEKIAGFMEELVAAYHKVLDNLYEDKVMETLIDIKVMDEMLHMDKYVEESKPAL